MTGFFANVTLQVPAASFDVTIARLRQLAFKVESENSTSQDVSEEFVDIDAQVRTLKVTEGTYLELLKKAVTLNDTLTIQRELNIVRTNIERLQGRMNYLQKKSDFSTITLSVSPRLLDAASQTPGWDFGKVLNTAWEGSLRGLQGLATVLIFIVVYSWWVLPLLLGLYLTARLGLKRFRAPLSPIPPANP